MSECFIRKTGTEEYRTSLFSIKKAVLCTRIGEHIPVSFFFRRSKRGKSIPQDRCPGRLLWCRWCWCSNRHRDLHTFKRRKRRASYTHTPVNNPNLKRKNCKSGIGGVGTSRGHFWGGMFSLLSMGDEAKCNGPSLLSQEPLIVCICDPPYLNTDQNGNKDKGKAWGRRRVLLQGEMVSVCFF